MKIQISIDYDRWWFIIGHGLLTVETSGPEEFC